MTTIKNSEEAEILPLENPNTGVAKTISLEDFKSVYYLLNAKPDRETKFYKDSKIVSLTNILELNDLFQEKLHLHNIVTNHVSAIVSLDNNKTFEFETWEQFVREKWHTSAITKTLTITWDFNVKLEHYQLPQRHTVKLRIGSGLRPKDMLELMMNYEEEDQLHQAFAHAVCSIDFINPVISSEIFLIIDNWHNALSANLFESKFQNFLINKASYIERGIIFLGLTAASTLLYAFSKPFLELNWHNKIDQLFLIKIFGGLLMSYLILGTYISYRPNL